MRELAVSEWLTIDGVFDADTMKEWFEPYDSAERQRYIRDAVHTADAVLVGRVSYEMLASYWPHQKNDEFGIADRLNSMPKFVVSSSLKEATWNNSTIIRDDVAAEVAKLKRQPGQRIIVYGSATLVESLLEEGLVDELRFLVHPVMAGKGKRFFKEGMGTTALELASTAPYPKGVLLLRYHPAREEKADEGELEEAVAASARSGSR